MKKECKKIVDEYKVAEKPNYIPQGNEEDIFLHAWRKKSPLY